MDVFAIFAAAIVAAVSALLLRRHNPQISLLISIAAGVIVLLSAVRDIALSADEISSVLGAAGISSQYIMILLKALGICFVTEFTCDTVSEAGMTSLSSNISFVGKLSVLMTAAPLYGELLSLITDMVKPS